MQCRKITEYLRNYFAIKHFVIADDKEEMARSILTLLDNDELRKEIEGNGRKLIEEKYQWNIVGEKLIKEIEEVLN